jgi:iron complex outermembrane receptor protein
MGGVRGDLRRIDAKATPTDDLVTDALTRDFRNFNFSGGFAYNINNSTFRGNVSSGFRAPNTSELLSNGKHEGTNRYEIGNKSLVSENAIQIDLAYELENEHFSLFINPFTNFIDNYIYLLPLDSIIENAPVFQYVQSKARLVGGEVSLHYHPHKIHWLHIESSFSTLFAQDDSGQDLPLIPATNINSRLKAELNTSGIHDTEVFLQHIYRFHQNKTAPFESVTSSYHLVNLGFSTSFDLGTIPVSFNTGIKNLFNTQYIDHLSRLKPMGIPNQGRNFYVGLQFGFTKDLNQ